MPNHTQMEPRAQELPQECPKNGAGPLEASPRPHGTAFGAPKTSRQQRQDPLHRFPAHPTLRHPHSLLPIGKSKTFTGIGQLEHHNCKNVTSLERFSSTNHQKHIYTEASADPGELKLVFFGFGHPKSVFAPGFWVMVTPDYQWGLLALANFLLSRGESRILTVIDTSAF